MTYNFRPAKLKDAKAIADILSNWIDETDWMVRIHTRDEDRGFGKFLIEKADVVVAENGGAIAGFLARRGEAIDALYLAPRARGLGLGRALVERAKREKQNLELWCFQANRGAREFYRKMNFREMHFTDGAGNDEKLPDVFLTWNKGSDG